MNQTREQEAQHLTHTQQRLQAALDDIDARVRRYAQEIQEQKVYLWENRAGMDHAEKVSGRQAVGETVLTGEAALAQKKRLLRLLASPYFGRFDFSTDGADGEASPLAVYVGTHGFADFDSNQHLIYDWRAPIASLFYDYETGKAHYEAPEGEIHGTIERKRQYRIRHGKLEFMLESAVNIVDDVLQEELSRASDERMKTIVATIQRDQNVIIRNAYSPVLVIQGVAGSGKTSIALHRIAYLLYRFKGTLTSQDILIISPNRVFADYISNVLPELGEEQVAEVQMDDLAADLLDRRYKFQTFAEQNALLLEKPDPALQARIQAKASRDFLQQLERYLEHLETSRFTPQDIWVNRKLIPAWYLQESWKKHRNLPDAQRLTQVGRDAEQKVGIHYNYNFTSQDKATLKTAIKAMLHAQTLRNVYKGLFDWLEQPELFQSAPRGLLEYADVFPLIYLKLRLEGINSPFRHIKHLLIDEMQDYTPVQYTVLARLFRCNKTILGDANQSLNPYSSSTAEMIKVVMPQAHCTTLTKSYRSSYEITVFAQGIAPNAALDPVERHGEAPQVRGFKTAKQEVAYIREQVQAFAHSGQRNLGIICKTQQQADKLYKTLHDSGLAIGLLGSGSGFLQGAMVCCVHIAKGLEFDQVIVPHGSAEHYASEMERGLLYIACTRAMHRLHVTYTGELTPLIPQGEHHAPEH